MVQHNFKINLSLFVAVISLLINLVFKVKTIDALIMVRHSPVFLHKPIYKPTYYTAPSLVSRRIHRHLYFNTPSPFGLTAGFNSSGINPYELKRSPPSSQPVVKLDSALSMTPKGMNFRRFMWNEMDETMDDLIQGVANGADVMKHIFVNSFAYPPPHPVRPTYYRFKPHFEYYKAPMEPGQRLRNFARDLSSKILNMPRKFMKIITVPPSLIPSVLPSITTIYKPAIATITTTVKSEKPLEHKFNLEEQLKTKAEIRNVIEPISMEELIGPMTLKELEIEGEKRVESHVISNVDEDVVSSKITEFDSSWTPIVNPSNTNQYESPKLKMTPSEIKKPKIREKFQNIHHHQSYEPEPEPEVEPEEPEQEQENEFVNHELIEPTSEIFYEITSQKSIPVSNLHIQVDDFKPIKYNPHYRQYEVTENSVEESKQILQSVKPTKKTQRKVPTSTVKPTKSKYVKTLPKPTSSVYYHHHHHHQRSTSSSTTTTTSAPTTTISRTTTTTIAPTTVPTIPTTTEKPNYPEYFLDKTFSDFEKFESNCDDEITTENSILKKLQVIVRKENLDNDKKYSHIQSVTTANPTKVKPIRKYSTKLKMSNFKDLYSKKSEIENSRKQTSTSTEIPSRKKDSIDLESTSNTSIRDQNRDSRKSSAIMRNSSKGKAFTTTRAAPQQNLIETTTVYANRDVNYFRKNKLRRGSRKYIEKE